MADPGAGAKFVPVNLNRSYGRHSKVSSSSGNNPPGARYGPGRARPGGVGAGGGGSMLVLSRSHGLQKVAGPKLSVPPPLNLPSRRKEHQRFDSSGSTSGAVAPAGVGQRPGLSGVGWIKPAAVVVPQEGEQVLGDNAVVDQGVPKGTGPVGSAYVPPSARLVDPASSGPSQGYTVPVVEKVTVLRGEDFPSLKAALPSGNLGLEKKQKDGAAQRQKLARVEEMPTGLRDGSTSSVLLDMRPHIQSKSNDSNNRRDGDGKQNRGSGVGLVGVERNGKQEDYSPGLLPWVQMSPRSDWEDDERDTGYNLVDRGRHQGYSKSEAYWERDFDFPRPPILPQKPIHDLFERSGLPANDTARMSRDINKADTSGKHVAAPSRDGREGNSWKAPSSLSIEGHNIHEAGNERDTFSVRSSGKKNGEQDKLPLAFQGHSRDDSGRRDAVYNHGGKQPWSNKMDSSVGRGLERNSQEHYGNEQLNRRKGEHFQNNFGLKSSSSSSGGKMVGVYDPVMNFGRDKHFSSKSGKHYVEDPVVKDMWMSDFDGSDHFSVGLVGLVKKKKEVLKQTEFHDPVRESFEAELERVQKMQEMERQRNLEEKERAMELPRREEEERMRLAREQEEQQRRLEEEAQEAAWRAEQQRLEAIQRAEEQRLAREEARRKALMEEERRKEAARQKLLELEDKIAKRQAEAGSSATSSSGFTDEKSSGMALKKDVLKVPDMGDWEDGERMAERIITSASYDSSMINRQFEIGSKHGTSVVMDRGKAAGLWKKDALDIGNRSSFFQQYQENEFHSPKWDASVGGRPFPIRKYQVGSGLMSFGPYQKEANSDPFVDEIGQSKTQGWNISREEHYTRTLGMELQDNLEDRYRDPGWGQNHPGENVYPPHRERMHHKPEDEGMYSFSRTRYSMRQPRVLPPPSFSSFHRIPVRSEQTQPGPSTFNPKEMQNSDDAGNETTSQKKLDDSLWESTLEAEVVDARWQSTRFEGQKLEGGSARCDSASSFSVSSPPDTPAHLSHDDLEESGDSLVVLSAKGNIYEEGKDCVVLPSEAVKATVLQSGVVSTAEEEEEWAVDNNIELQQQEEYDEDGSYEEEDGVQDGEDDNVKLAHELDGEMFEGNDSPDINNSVLCFNEGVEVKMPNDEFERSLRNEGNLPPVDDSAPTSNDASRVLRDTQILACDFSIEHKAGTQMSTAMELSSQAGTPESSVLPNQSQAPSLSSEAVQGPAISVPTQPEVPLNLQFGLFSGPPLIPSPVPAIQIGSIQMPLHLHPPIGPSLSNTHQLQPTLFHFGQLRYTSPISPEILPLAPQSVSYGHMSISNNTESKSGTVILPRESGNDSTKLQHSSRDLSQIDQRRSTPEVGIQAEDSCMNNLKPSPATESADERVFGSVPSQMVPNQGNFGMSKSQGPPSGGRGRRYVTTSKFGSRSLLPTPDASRLDSGEFHRRSRRQRTEFRVRENPHRVHGFTPSYSYEVNDRSNNIGRSGRARSAVRHMPNRLAKQTYESHGSNFQPVTSLGKDIKVGENKSSRNSHSLPYSGEHADASLQGGIGSDVEKPDTETPGDDDFIEVRSRRQVLNERRAQREKEIKAKSRVQKIPRKPHCTSQAVVGCASSNKASAISGLLNHFSSDYITAERRSIIKASETSAGIKSPSVSQPLPPIGTPAVKSGVIAKADKSSQQIRSVQTSSLVSDGGKRLTPESVYVSGDKLLNDVQISVGSQGNSHITQQVMALTQTQLDEAMQPAHFDSRSAVGVSKNKVGEPSQPPASTLNKDKSLSSAASSINSSLSGEKIQFAEGCCSLFQNKEKNVDQSSLPLQDCEAEAKAKAATSAVVATICSNENGLANGSLSVNSSCLGGANIGGIAAEAGSCNQQCQVRPDEHLNITLPADLSVETPPIPLWPPLSSPQNASSPMLSHLPGGLPGHFPFYEMNPLMEGHMFAFGRPEEPATSQSQSQQTNAILSGPLGTWQHHPSIDSVYGPPSGFAGPFIGPPGSVPGVQGPAHMVVYNHLAPVGQFGQVGLSFMGTRYVPSGKQTDWKHIPASSPLIVREGDLDSMSMVPAQHNLSKMPAAIQHIAPRPPLIPMTSPVAMFDVSPLQTPPDMTAQTRWLHVSAAPIQSIQATMSLQQQVLPVKHRPSINQQSASSGFVESQSETPSENSGNYAVTTDATITQLPDELGLVNSTSVGAGTSAQSVATKSSSGTSILDSSKSAAAQNGTESKTSGQNMNDSLKAQASQKNPAPQHSSSSSAYNNQRDGGVSQRTFPGGERNHRRPGYHGRNNHSFATEKGHPQSKTKQIYVAKPSKSGTSAP